MNTKKKSRFCRLPPRWLRLEEKSFTLVELIVTMAVIGILAGIVIPNFGVVKGKARLAACKSNLKNISIALASYYAEHDTYPPALDAALVENVSQLLQCPEDKTYTYSLKNGRYSVRCSRHKLELTEDGIAFYGEPGFGCSW